MTKSLLLNVGTGEDAKPVHFNLKVLKRSHLLITGASGSGKSYFERVIAEQIVGRVQTFVIDPEGEYITLREKFPFLLVGEGGELPIHPRTAGVLAERLMKLGVSAIFDLSSMEVADQHLWVKNFVHALMKMHPKDTHDLVVVVDESHLFCPEKGEGESVAKEDMLNLASRGRKRGFTNIWATQRLAKLANNAASELQNTCIGRVFLVNDRERAAKILGIPQRSKTREEFYTALKVLDQGIFYAQGVAISVDLIAFQVKESETRHPDPGERSSRRIVVPTPEQIKKLVPELAAIPVEAEEKEKTEKQLRAEIAELKRQLRTAQSAFAAADVAAGKADPAQLRELRANLAALGKRYDALKSATEDMMKIVAKVTAIGFENTTLKPEDFKAVLEQVAVQIGKMAEKKVQQRTSDIEDLKKELSRFQRRLSSLLERKDKEINVAVDVQHNKPFTVEPATPRAPRPIEGNGNITGSQMRILGALASLNAIGRDAPRKSTIAVLAVASSTSSTFGNNLSALRTAGLIDYRQPGTASLTEAGLSMAPEVNPPASADEMLAFCKRLASSSQGRILEELQKRFPRAVPKEELAEAVEASAISSTFGNNLSFLRTAGMIVYPSKGTAKLESWVMLED